MSLNKVKGNMYPFADHTWNTIKGICSHDCSYCYTKRWGEQKPVRLDEKELNTDLLLGKFIFIGSSCDMFAGDIPAEWIKKTLDRANSFENQYLIQTKNPLRYHQFLDDLDPGRFMLCTTMETNRNYETIMRKAPLIPERTVAMQRLPRQYDKRKMITIEPIMDFDLKDFSYMILCCHPVQVNIGADSGGNHLPEPNTKKIRALIEILERHTTVFKKDNLKRLVKEAA
jgi:DNA repair photolyase